MTLIIKTEPVNPLFTQDQIKSHLCLTDDFTDTDATVSDYGDAVTSYLDGGDGVLGRGLITQTWTLIRNTFANNMSIPLPPLQTVDEIRFLDTAGVQQILDPTIYRVVYAGARNRRALVTLAENQSYPAIDHVLGAIEIDFTCGYGDSWNDIPANTRQLALMLLASLFERRDAEIVGTIVAINPAVERAINIAAYQEAVL